MSVAFQGLEDAIGVSVVHPTWQKTKPDDPSDEHTGWTFASPDDPPFQSPTGAHTLPLQCKLPVPARSPAVQWDFPLKDNATDQVRASSGSAL